MTRPRLAIAAGLLWRTVALALVIAGLGVLSQCISAAVDAVHDNPEPLPCVAYDSCGDE